ncbi:hypothetical protein [uncultured Prevotella sp.]|uniref:hypothetical protein n=1 Tax=uncultured Prevotella sp. TaxID=159272 RepID=UPI002590F739|nr:hypothetical protein [uncultured Prevotella sp.]
MIVGIICFWDRYATPYLLKYEQMLQQAEVQYEILFWNRESKQSEASFRQQGNEVYLDYNCKEGKQKLFSFYGWAKHISRFITKRKYSHLILLSTVPAVLLMPTVMRKYKGKYIFDIRDYTLEKYFIFRKLVMRLVNHSCLTPISSKGFLKWLDVSPKIIPNHNITVSEDNSFTAPDFSEDCPIRFSFVGNVRLDKQTEAMVRTLGHSSKIKQHYYGRVLSVCNIREIIKEDGLTNVYLHGPFDVKEKETIYKDTDLINTVYANAEKEEDIPLGDSTPLPNRLYDALIFYRPLVTSKGTYLAELSDEYHLGVNVNGFDENLEEEIVNYTKTFDRKAFMDGCDKLRALVTEEENTFRTKIAQIFKTWKEDGC